MMLIHQSREGAASRLATPGQLAPPPPVDPPEVLFPEARRRRRRRRLFVATVLLVVAAAAVLGISISVGHAPPARPGATAHSGGTPAPAVVPNANPSHSTPGRVLYPEVPPFGQVAVAPNGTLYYVDQQAGEIVELTSGGPKVVLSSVGGVVLPPAVGLRIVGKAVWFTANGGVYEMTLAGRDVRRVADAPGATSFDVLADGTIYYAAEFAVFEQTPGGQPHRVAGGGTVGMIGAHDGIRATDVAVTPGDLVGISRSLFYFTSDNELDVVQNGSFSAHRGLVDFFNGEITVARSGTIYAICRWSMCRISGTSFTPIFKIVAQAAGTFASPIALAVGPNGHFFVSFTNQAGEPETKAGIYEMSDKGKLIRVLAVR